MVKVYIAAAIICIIAAVYLCTRYDPRDDDDDWDDDDEDIEEWRTRK